MYISKAENAKLHFGDYPSAKFIHKVAEVLEPAEDEVLLLAHKAPADIRQRIREKPEAFSDWAKADDKTLEKAGKIVEKKRTAQ